MEISGVDLNELEIDYIGSWPLFVRVGVVVGVFILTIFAGYMLYLSDEWDELNNKQNKRVELETTFANAQHKVANLDAYVQQVKLVQAELSKLTEQLPQSNQEAGLLEDISQQAASSGLQFVSIKPNAEQSRGFYIENPVKLTLSGSYQGIGEFASSIASMPRIVTFHDFTIIRLTKTELAEQSTSLGQPLKGPLLMSIVTKTYWTAPESIKVGR